MTALAEIRLPCLQRSICKQPAAAVPGLDRLGDTWRACGWAKTWPCAGTTAAPHPWYFGCRRTAEGM